MKGWRQLGANYFAAVLFFVSKFVISLSFNVLLFFVIVPVLVFFCNFGPSFVIEHRLICILPVKKIVYT